MTTRALNGNLTLAQFIGILLPALVLLFTALTYVVDARVAAHGATPYHPGVRDIIYDQAKGVALEGKVNGLDGRLERIEKDISEIKQALKEQRRRP